MPEWYYNKECLSYESQVDQSISNWRAQIKDNEDSLKGGDMRSTFNKIKLLTKH